MKNQDSKKEWNNHVYKRRTDFTGDIKKICNLFKFDYFINCGPGYVGAEAWSLKSLYPSCNILGFEPQTERYNHLISGSFPGVLEQKAVGASKGHIEGLMGFIGGKSDFWLNGDENLVEGGFYKKEIVEITTIDDILENINGKAFIWADIEGSELEMVKGATKSMEQDKIVGFNLELRTQNIPSGHCSYQEVVDYLKPFNYITKDSKSLNVKDYIFSKW